MPMGKGLAWASGSPCGLEAGFAPSKCKGTVGGGTQWAPHHTLRPPLHQASALWSYLSALPIHHLLKE